MAALAPIFYADAHNGGIAAGAQILSCSSTCLTAEIVGRSCGC